MLERKSNKQVWIMRHSIRSDLGLKPESDCNITKEGIDLAIEKGKTLKQKVPKLNVIFTSPFLRTRETAKCIASSSFAETPIRINFDLSETLTYNHNNYKNVTLSTDFIQQLQENGIVYPQTDEQVLKRCAHLIEMLTELQEDKILLISHAGLIQTLVYLFCSQPCALDYCDYIGFEFDVVEKKWNVISKK